MTKIMQAIKIQCPAKINLDLKITGKLPNGFHEIESIMQTISLYDYLTINVEDNEKNGIILSGNSSEIPYDESNLVYKAAKLFLETTGIENKKIDIYIEKNIPVSAGLAGGSTDAAGTLYGLNKIFKISDEKKIDGLCSQLGSDLNVCLHGGRILAKGRGEIITPLEFEDFNVSLIKPINLGISAKEAYTKFSQKKQNCHPELYKTNKRGTSFVSLYASAKPLAGSGSINLIYRQRKENLEILKQVQNDKFSLDCTKKEEHFENDLEWAIIDDYKELQYIKQKYPNSIMTGSGSTYFMIDGDFENEDGYWVKNGLKAVDFGVMEF